MPFTPCHATVSLTFLGLRSLRKPNLTLSNKLFFSSTGRSCSEGALAEDLPLFFSPNLARQCRVRYGVSLSFEYFTFYFVFLSVSSAVSVLFRAPYIIGLCIVFLRAPGEETKEENGRNSSKGFLKDLYIFHTLQGKAEVKRKKKRTEVKTGENETKDSHRGSGSSWASPGRLRESAVTCPRAARPRSPPSRPRRRWRRRRWRWRRWR